jgi:hypothetical protein
MNMGCQGEGGLDITANGHIDEFSEWGAVVAQTDPNSIAQTSIRLDTLTATACPQ